MNAAAIKAWAIAHKTGLLVGGGALGVTGLALHRRNQTGGDPAAPAVETTYDPQTIPSGGAAGASGDYSAVSARLNTQTKGIARITAQLRRVLRRERRLQRGQRRVLHREQQLRHGQKRTARKVARIDRRTTRLLHYTRAHRAPVHHNRVSAAQRARRQARRRRAA